jgi:hypothetical protein
MCHQVDFDPAKLYRKIMTEVVSDTNFNLTQLQSIQLRCIIEETIISKAFLKRIQSEAFGRGTKVPDQPQKNISSEPQRHNPPRSIRASAPPQSKSPPPPPPFIPDPSKSTSYTRSSCTKCSALPASKHCVLLLNVRRRTDVKNLFGSLVTCAPQDDRIPLNVSELFHIVLILIFIQRSSRIKQMILTMCILTMICICNTWHSVPKFMLSASVTLCK